MSGAQEFVWRPPSHAHVALNVSGLLCRCTTGAAAPREAILSNAHDAAAAAAAVILLQAWVASSSRCSQLLPHGDHHDETKQRSCVSFTIRPMDQDVSRKEDDEDRDK
mmetsp:Transcript_65915/g.157616  ORF Transcript_65915/g.157616 Transcript_65915/m.157616 type:complete len:108 (-) Transcript_65915:695-1018(-)